MKEDMGLTETGDVGDKFLEGNYRVPEGVDESAQDILNNLKA